MSDNRDEATGQFTPSTDGLYGREAELAEAGYTMKKDPPAEGEAKNYDGDFAGLREAAADRVAEQQRKQPLEISVDDYREAVGKRDPMEAVTPEQAAEELSSAREDVSRFVDGLNLQQLAETVDKARAEELKKNPRAADELGLSNEDIEAAAKTVDKDETVRQTDKVAKRAAEAPTVDGLDPEVERALKHPQVRQAIEEEFGRAETAKQDYTNALQTANHFATASLVDHFPELAGIPTQNWEAALLIFQQNAPDRFNRAMGTLERVSQIQAAQAQWQQHESHAQRQRFQSYKAEQDAVFNERIKGEKPERIAELAEAVAQYAEEFGVSRAQLKHLSDTNEIVRHAAFQSMMADAARYRLMQKAVPRAAPKGLPPVQRPGVTSAAPRGSDNASKIQALQRQLEATSSDSKAARIAGQILTLKRAS